MCVRLAYELNMHLVDARGAVQATTREDWRKWRDEEEKRRAWWAIWEMDVFASTVRRTPTAVDWAQMEILLPADDADWFNDRPARSSFMERDPVKRWKVLQDSGNGSPWAWFLVINSLMKDAQVISSPRGVPSQSDNRSRQQYDRRRGKASHLLGPVQEARQKLEILANAVQCFVLALPAHLEYRNQYLSFDGTAAAPGRIESLQHLHSGIHNIFMMTQLARLMIYRYHLFGAHAHSPQSGGPDDAVGQSLPGLNDPGNSSVRQYFEAADNILMIVSRSCEDHIRYINPFLPSTIWLAAAVQLVRKYVKPPASNPGLTQSRFDVLYLTYKRCAVFWEAKTAMGQNLEMLEMQLQAHYHQHPEQGGHIHPPPETIGVPPGQNAKTYPGRNLPRSTSNGRTSGPIDCKTGPPLTLGRRHIQLTFPSQWSRISLTGQDPATTTTASASASDTYRELLQTKQPPNGHRQGETSIPRRIISH